ncbi:uncharacterized protein CBO05P1_227 [Clostridium botulinum B str. Osaka05]|uniref:Uncharacterized protein n=1 Tax=Clostridium botulinum B str. Osaka05 TaxID=1407017 RepID=A0A060N394_CLOBO|nr:hypothetical protein [Clostridium botulinum]BAO04946.1 uncharacterized protein CBO05P1_227 [Clostridium botulinum B str. Osaka05]
MDTNIFICQLSKKVQNKIKRLVIEYLKKEGYFTDENLNNIMDGRLVDLQDENFRSQYDLIIKEIEKEKIINLNKYIK